MTALLQGSVGHPGKVRSERGASLGADALGRNRSDTSGAAARRDRHTGGDTLLSVLRQLRAGYDRRPEGFPQSVVLCGLRDVDDYRIHSPSDRPAITSGSPFNIKARSLRLGDFSRDETLAPVGAAHGGDRRAIHAGCPGHHLDADARPAMAGQRVGQRNLLLYRVGGDRRRNTSRNRDHPGARQCQGC